MKHMYKMKGNKNMSKKEFVLKKNGKITIAEAQKETKIKKTYTLSPKAISQLEDLSEKLGNNSISSTIEQVVDIVTQLLQK